MFSASSGFAKSIEKKLVWLEPFNSIVQCMNEASTKSAAKEAFSLLESNKNNQARIYQECLAEYEILYYIIILLNFTPCFRVMVKKNQHFAALCRKVLNFLNKTENSTFGPAFFSLSYQSQSHKISAIVAQSCTVSGFTEAKTEFNIEPAASCM